jgi:hypothetical protein
MKLPNGPNAELGAKLKDYCLNPLHPRGQHKARLFQTVLGITISNSDLLAAALLNAAANSDDAKAEGDNGFGEIYELEFELTTEIGRARIVSAWIVLRGESFPRLLTCFIV